MVSPIDHNMPIIVSHIQTTAKESLASLFQSIVYPENAERVSGGGAFTWATLDAGMVVSRAAMEILSENLGRSQCRFWVDASLTISRCAWKRGIFLANSDRMRTGLQLDGDISDHVVDNQFCTETVSAHYFDSVYRSRYTECRLVRGAVPVVMG